MSHPRRLPPAVRHRPRRQNAGTDPRLGAGVLGHVAAIARGDSRGSVGGLLDREMTTSPQDCGRRGSTASHPWRLIQKCRAGTPRTAPDLPLGTRRARSTASESSTVLCVIGHAVVLHVSDHGLPALSVPSVYMTAVRSGPIAVPDLTHLSRACLKRGEATLHETRLAFHEPTLPLPPNRSRRATAKPPFGAPPPAPARSPRDEGRTHCSCPLSFGFGNSPRRRGVPPPRCDPDAAASDRFLFFACPFLVFAGSCSSGWVPVFSPPVASPPGWVSSLFLGGAPPPPARGVGGGPRRPAHEGPMFLAGSVPSPPAGGGGGGLDSDLQVNRRSSSCDEIGCAQPSN